MTDAFEDEAEPTISIKDYLKEVEEKELEADLVLGADEGKECTYSKGYMKRQAIFSCLTCTPDGNAGVCTACSLSCHDGHEIAELWTKRNFKCDCGNSKFGAFYCKLFPSKDPENSDNSYNHNFKGLYCTCNRLYPDPNAEEQEEMIQCCICEDWFHEEHLGLESPDQIPKDEEREPLYDEFICQSCSVVFSFLTLYTQNIWAAVEQQNGANMLKDKEAVIENPPPPLESLGMAGDGSSSLDTSTVTNNPENILTGEGTLLSEDSAKDGVLNPCSQSAGPISECSLGVNLVEAAASLENSKPMFLSKHWREVLCRCEQCAAYYNQKKIDFVLDKEDSIAEYEKMAKQKRNEKMQQEEDVEQSLLNNLDHVGKIEFLSGVADMKSEIQAFLESTDQSKPITSDDIHQIFENLAKKRRRML